VFECADALAMKRLSSVSAIARPLPIEAVTEAVDQGEITSPYSRPDSRTEHSAGREDRTGSNCLSFQEIGLLKSDKGFVISKLRKIYDTSQFDIKIRYYCMISKRFRL
jgi:hypothetical protein